MTVRQYWKIIKRYIQEYDIKVAGYYKTPLGYAESKSRRIWIPRPVTELCFYICLHEIGHIASGLKVTSPQWLHEFKATEFALYESDKLGIEYSKETREAIRGYLKYILICSLQKSKRANRYPDKVFKMAGLNKSYCRKKLNNGFIPVMDLIEGSLFSYYREVKVNWKQIN